MKIVFKPINKEIVKAIPLVEPEDQRPVLGWELFPEVFANICIVSRKKTGKTTIIHKILKQCVGKETKKVLLFVSTAYKDPNWISIRKMLESKKDTEVEVHTSLYDDGINQLDALVEELEQEAKEREEAKEEGIEEAKMHNEKTDVDKLLDKLKQENGVNGYIDLEDDEKEKKKRKSKFKMPEYVIVLDDLSNEVKSPSLNTLLKKNRHFKCKVIISSQWIHDFRPEALKQMDYWLILKGQSMAKLEKIYKDADLSITFDRFVNIYKESTTEKFSFLYIDGVNMLFRRNFNMAIEFRDNDEVQKNTEITKQNDSDSDLDNI